MSFQIIIVGATAAELAANAAAIAAQLGGAAPAASTGKSSRAKPAEPASGGAAGASQPATTDPNPASGSAATDGASGGNAATDTAITRETLTPLCNQLAAKSGTGALQELFKEVGSEQGKFSQVPEANFPALKARLDELLAA